MTTALLVFVIIGDTASVLTLLLVAQWVGRKQR